ncbi:MAG: radical SAM family heme chaperone HemW [Caulobacteraceae bacterium]
MNDPPPIGVYIHWPYCARVCPYCDFNVVKDRGRTQQQQALVQAVAADLAAAAARMGERRLVSIFFGGGTPSLMQPAWIAELIALAHRLWTPAEHVEITLEANPTDAHRFVDFAAAGVNRLSLGLQALDDAALKFLGRNHDAAQAREAVALAARTFPRLSLDMIYALPGQSPAAWADSLRVAADLGGEHLSPYQLTIEPDVPFGRAVRRGLFTPPDSDAAAVLYQTTGEVLEGLGFDAYEVSNHARGQAARSRHNLVYWRGEDYVGAGPGAHGRLTVSGTRIATEAARNIDDYIARTAATGASWREEELDAVAVAEERLILGLRIDEGVALSDLAALQLTPETPRLADMLQAGLLTLNDGRLIATPAGRLLLDRVIGDLAA